nr:WW domain-binding protein 11-like [Aegilops tauschii subsp. strangulata]
MGTTTYLLDKEHLPLRPEFEDNTIVMNEEDPTSVQAQEKSEKEKAEKAGKMPSVEEASQESLETIIKTKFYDLDMKVIEMQTAVEQLQEEAEEKKGKATTDAFQRVPRGQRSAAVSMADTRANTSAPAATTSPLDDPPTPAVGLPDAAPSLDLAEGHLDGPPHRTASPPPGCPRRPPRAPHPLPYGYREHAPLLLLCPAPPHTRSADRTAGLPQPLPLARWCVTARARDAPSAPRAWPPLPPRHAHRGPRTGPRPCTAALALAARRPCSHTRPPSHSCSCYSP